MPYPSTLHSTGTSAPPTGRRRPAAALAASAVVLLAAGLAWGNAAPASAAEAPVGLGTAGSFAVLAGSEITNTGPSVVSGDLGIAPGSAVTGFPPGLVADGTPHVTDGVARQAKDDLTTAYDDAAGRSTTVDVTGTDLGGRTLVSGVYSHTSGMQLTGTVTLDAQGDPDAVFVFQAGSTLVTASSSTVALVNGASPCNVYWQVGSSATLGSGTDFVGTIMALTSATLDTGADVEGRVLARNGAVTLDTNDITAPSCAAAPSPTPTPPTATPTDAPTAPDGDQPSGDGGPGGPGDGGSGTGDGSGLPGGPVVPVGNPGTGFTPQAGDHGPQLLYGMAAVAFLGSVVALGRAARAPRRQRAD